MCRYGDFVVLHDHDHISVCKPSDTSDPAYAKLMAFLHTRVRALRKVSSSRSALLCPLCVVGAHYRWRF